MVTQEKLRNSLVGKIRLGEISKFPDLFTACIFGGGSDLSKLKLLNLLECLFKMAVDARGDDLALAILKKMFSGYRAVEEEIEEKKELRQKHLGNAMERADKKLYEFFISAYFKISREMMTIGRPLMKKTRFQIFKYVAQYWTQEMTDESYVAFRFLMDVVMRPPEEKEILDEILRPRVEKAFSDANLIGEWLLSCSRNPIPYEVQQLLVMARAKNGGPELAKQDIANSRILGPELPLGPEDLEDLITSS